jgi:DHA2 family multidrug resistance protein
VFMTLSAPLAAWMAARFDQRLVMLIGLALFAVSFWMISAITPEWGFGQLFATQAVRGVATLFCMVPSVGMALNDMPDDELHDASGLINLMRNLGGALGIAMVNTWLQHFYRLHLDRLAEGLGAAPQAAQDAIVGATARLGQTLDPERAAALARAGLGQVVALQALALSFQDVFRLIAWLFVAAILIIPFCKGGSMMPHRH